MKTFALASLVLLFGCATVHPKQVLQPRAPQVEPMTAVETKATAHPAMKCPNTGNCVVHLSFGAEIDEDSVTELQAGMDEAVKIGARAIVLELNTPGGEIDAGHKLIRSIEELPIPTFCVADHQVASEGFAVLQSCTVRMMTKRTAIMTHEVRVTGTAGGTPKDIRNSLNELEAYTRAFSEHCAARMKIDFQAYMSHVEGGKDWWMNWPEALQFGAVDFVVPSVGYVTNQLVSTPLHE